MDSQTMSCDNQWQALINKKVTREILPSSGLEAGSGKPYITLINSQSVLEVKGPDAEKFLQGQCSADIGSLKEQTSVSGCICTVKGRVLCTFIATKVDDRILLKMTAELVGPMREYLGKYAAFFKVELIEWSTPCVLETSQSQGFQTKTIPLVYDFNKQGFSEHLVEPEHLDSIVEEVGNFDELVLSEDHWSDRQINSGWLNLTPETSEKYLPHQLNLERLNAISFTKGCYTGQEIIARTEYRGKPKRRMHLIEIEELSQHKPSLPADIIDGESNKTLGILLSVSSEQKQGLAILPVDNEGSWCVKVDGRDFKLGVPEQPYPSEKS